LGDMICKEIFEKTTTDSPLGTQNRSWARGVKMSKCEGFRASISERISQPEVSMMWIAGKDYISEPGYKCMRGAGCRMDRRPDEGVSCDARV